ncbi:hypothetical protein SAMN04487981_105176 [Streptomyces sp. cf386]|uniref:Rv1733c family protein n=1 Tax=Streptomyces sp. cf386 TaxID=1761904 RepID=UPI00088D5BAE|nr:hypothetical protein [Streptomyces sp. cf386]SDN47394.1 hypothetical protein SAMN04487981_105176 [Streptomyces sp. cf386]
MVPWNGPDGTPRTGLARVDPGAETGETTRVWVNDKGALTPEPASPDQAEVQGAVLGTAVAVSVGAAVALAGWGVSTRLDSRRLRQWDTEWEKVGPQWGPKAG